MFSRALRRTVIITLFCSLRPILGNFDRQIKIRCSIKGNYVITACVLPRHVKARQVARHLAVLRDVQLYIRSRVIVGDFDWSNLVFIFLLVSFLWGWDSSMLANIALVEFGVAIFDHHRRRVFTGSSKVNLFAKVKTSEHLLLVKEHELVFALDLWEV
jgi:hypothetical protein